MMAGTFLDVETANDQATAQDAAERARYGADPEQAEADIRGRLVSAGFTDSEAATVGGILVLTASPTIRSDREKGSQDR
jgi:hypothetical protein